MLNFIKYSIKNPQWLIITPNFAKMCATGKHVNITLQDDFTLVWI